MHKLHGFACNLPPPAASRTALLARPDAIHAPALKPIHKAGRRGGESIARQAVVFNIKNYRLSAS